LSFLKSERVLSDAEMEQHEANLRCAVWEIVPNRGYQTADVSQLYPEYKRAFFLKLPDGTAIHKHVDCGDCRTDHVVMSTNERCLNFWVEDDKDRSVHMEKGSRYEVDRTVLHWAENNGITERVHLLLEY